MHEADNEWLQQRVSPRVLDVPDKARASALVLQQHMKQPLFVLSDVCNCPVRWNINFPLSSPNSVLKY